MSLLSLRSTFFLLGPLACCAPVMAQEVLSFQWLDKTDGPTLSSSTPGAMQRSVCADFTGDRHRDVFTLIDTEPVFFYAPGTWDGYHAWTGPTGVNDIDTIPGPSGTRADLAVVDSSGLSRIHFESSTNLPSPFSTSSISTDTAWQGATRVRVGYVDDTSSPQTADFVGITANKHTVVVLRDVSGTLVQSSFTLPWTIEDVALVQWDGSGELEVALLDTYGVEVYTRGGTRLKRFARNAAGGDSFCVFHKGCTETRDFIAWIRRKGTSNNDQELVELHSEAGTDPQLVTTDVDFTGTDLAVCVVAADLPAEGSCTRGESDLIVHHQDHFGPIHFRNQHTPEDEPTFMEIDTECDPEVDDCPPTSYYVDSLDDGLRASAVDGAASMPLPAFADFTGDSVPDLFVPIQSGTVSRFQVWRGSAADWNSNPALAGAYIWGAQLLTSDDNYHNDLTVDVELGWLSDTANALEVVVWSFVAGSSYIEYRAEGRFIYQDGEEFPLPDDEETAILRPTIELRLTGFSGDPLTEVYLPDEECFERLYWLDIKKAVYYPNASPPTLEAASPSYIVVVGSKADYLAPWVNDDFSEAACFDEFAQDALDFCDTEECHTGQPGGGTPVSTGAISRRRMAPPGTGIPPAPPSTITNGGGA